MYRLFLVKRTLTERNPTGREGTHRSGSEGTKKSKIPTYHHYATPDWQTINQLSTLYSIPMLPSIRDGEERCALSLFRDLRFDAGM